MTKTATKQENGTANTNNNKGTNANATVEVEADQQKQKTKEERQAEIIPKFAEALRRGLKVLAEAFDVIHPTSDEMGADSENEDGTPKGPPLPVYEPKVSHARRATVLTIF